MLDHSPKRIDTSQKETACMQTNNYYCSISNGASPDSKMAEKQCKQNETSDKDVSKKLDSLISAVHGRQKSQGGLRKMFESKLDKLRTDLMENIDGKVQSCQYI